MWSYTHTHGLSTRGSCKSVSGLVTVCPYNIWCRGLTMCILYVGLLYGKNILKELVHKLDIIHISIICIDKYHYLSILNCRILCTFPMDLKLI